jgi:hypothetical protein
MASKVDVAADKRRKQIIFLVVGGVLLVGLAILQAPKVLHHGPKQSAAATATTTTDASTVTDTSGTATPAPAATDSTAGTAVPAVATVGTGPAAKVAGVLVRSAGAARPTTGQLWSLSRFKAHDPFVQQVSDQSSTPAASDTTKAGSTSGATSGGGAPAANPADKTGATTAVPAATSAAALAYVTLMVNGKAQQLTLKDVFPKGQPTFVLRSVSKKTITIGVAGGKFVGGAIVKLEFGQRVTLMNTATGQRFVMKLVYTGPQPEEIAGFKAPVAGSTASATATTAAPKS